MPAPDSGDSLAERAELAAVAPRHRIDPFFKETAKQVLIALARNPNLQEHDLLRLLERKDLPSEAIKEIATRKEAVRSYPIKLSLAVHAKTPRLIALPLLKFFYLFDLVRITQRPGVPAEVKSAAEESILKKFEGLPRGEKIALARRGSGRVAAALLITEDRELIRAALDNPFLSEAHLTRVLSVSDLPSAVVESIAQHDKWSRRYHLRLSMVRNRLTPLARVLAFLPDLALNDLRDVCLDRRMPDHVRKYILAHCAKRLSNTPRLRRG